MRDLLKSLAGCQDVASLGSTIHELFTEFGEVARLEIVTMMQPGKRQALCFIRLASAEQELRLMAHPGVTRFGSDLLLVVDLPGGQANIAGQPEESNRDRPGRDDSVQGPGIDQNENAGDGGIWSNPARWGATLLAAAQRVLDRELGWSSKRLVR